MNFELLTFERNRPMLMNMGGYLYWKILSRGNGHFGDAPSSKQVGTEHQTPNAEVTNPYFLSSQRLNVAKGKSILHFMVISLGHVKIHAFVSFFCPELS
uniref:Uncharacterized protein n=1 Tax=Ditylenchus dipsaci TaxID=166011 RepID=A0A915DDL3_9BILA